MFLNTIDAGGSFPNHQLKLKQGFVVMLLRNISPPQSHSNGTKYTAQDMSSNVLFCVLYKVQMLETVCAYQEFRLSLKNRILLFLGVEDLSFQLEPGFQ